MIIECPGCRARYRIDAAATRKKTVRVRCPKCEHLFSVALDQAEKKVLVVDDSRFFREMIVDVLQPLQVTFLTAGEGNEALQIIRMERPALTILDLNLPGLDGFSLIREVRSDPALKDLRLLAISGVFRKEKDALQAEAAGADDFLSKSFKPQQLLSRVSSLLER